MKTTLTIAAAALALSMTGMAYANDMAARLFEGLIHNDSAVSAGAARG
jgi:hypothetical protein